MRNKEDGVVGNLSLLLGYVQKKKEKTYLKSVKELTTVRSTIFLPTSININYLNYDPTYPCVLYLFSEKKKLFFFKKNTLKSKP